LSTIELRNVHAGYGEIEILHGVDLEAEAGEVTCLIGPNGAGKSTILKSLAGIIKPTSGSILFEGIDMTRTSTLERLRRGIAHVPQGRCNFPDMTVRENLEMGAYLMKRSEARAAVERVLDAFPLLRERVNDLAGNLSGGQQQILEMGMALVRQPRCLLIDEPSLGLSPKMEDVVFQEIRRLKMMGIAVVMVEQNAHRGLQISDRGIALELGHVRFVGTGAELLANPEVKLLYLGGARNDSGSRRVVGT
jgi:branched-chain amino acid transport system ATP-binding protein